MTLAWSKEVRARTEQEAISVAQEAWQDFADYCGWGPPENRLWRARNLSGERWEVTAWNRQEGDV
jgi:hypothetical protein